ncbi:MAG: DNA-binding response regulator [Actinobacteria bacterium]|nr:DNA-binding response regulator [Actinomycetota bacterium]
MEAFERKTPNLVLLDVMLPNMSGLDVCRLIRLKSEVPVIMVTAKTEEVDAVVALELGADDYVTKPYQFRELVARVRAILRRAEARNQDKAIENVPSRLKAGDLVIDQDRHEVLLNDQLIALPLKEYELLLQLVANAGRALSRDDLIDAVWGTDYVGDTKTLDVHIRRIRSRIEDDPQRPLRVITIRGVGYRYEV